MPKTAAQYSSQMAERLRIRNINQNVVGSMPGRDIHVVNIRFLHSTIHVVYMNMKCIFIFYFHAHLKLVIGHAP